MVTFSFTDNRGGGSLKAQVASWRLASGEIWHFEETRVALAGMRPWVTEEAAKARRPRNLLEDNPASG